MPRTLQQYLDDHNGDHAAALAAAVADVAQREGENGTARSFRRVFEPILRELDIPPTQDGADQLREQLSSQGDSAALAEYAESLTEVLEGLGIDFNLPETELNAAIEALPGQWEAYRALGDDPAALATRLTAGDTAVEREQSRELAEASNGASPSVLADRLRQSGRRAEVRNVPAEGSHPARREVRVLNAEGQDQGERPRREDRREAQGEGGRPQNRPPRGPRPDDRRGPRPDKRADNRRDGGQERREKQPDPNSPFAKLMALKAQLEDGKK